MFFGSALFATPLTPAGRQFAGSIIAAGYLWPLMKTINLIAGLMLIFNRLPALALLLLVPITVVIVWFQIAFTPLPVPLATVAVIIACELWLLYAYRSSYAGLLNRRP